MRGLLDRDVCVRQPEELLNVAKVQKIIRGYMSKKLGLKDFMSPTQRKSLGNLPTTHRNCIEKCGVARPGKTARDRAKLSGRREA